MNKGWFSKLVERYKTWRFKREMQKRHPDPFIVCSWARKCAHVDGILCDPKTCEDPTFYMQEEARKGANP